MTATLESLAVGDRVYLATDPRQDEGVVSHIEAGRVFVTWRYGRTWVYAASQLQKL
jgi:hypothetical protein